MFARPFGRFIGVAMTLAASAVLVGALWAGGPQAQDISWGASFGSVVLH